MTSTVVPPNQAVAEWLRVFHAEGTDTYASSLTFTKRLTVIAISIITYLKNWLPENCYTVETFAGLKLTILKNKCKDEMAQFLSKSLVEAFFALDKKYLQRLALLVYEGECKEENLIEYHMFEYSYCSEGVAMTIHNKDRKSLKFEYNVQDQTRKLIRACIEMVQLSTQGLPESATISFHHYYNDDAPEGYQLPGYERGYSRDDHLGAKLSKAVQLGCVESPYHETVAKCYMRDTSRDSSEANTSSNPPVMPNPESEDASEQGEVPSVTIDR